MTKSHYFQNIVPEHVRSSKPRSSGMTMVIDWGIGLRQQSDLLETAADFFDLAKIAVGISGLLHWELLASKIHSYQQQGVEPFPGGQFLEYASVTNQADSYLAEVIEAGYRWVEVSDNLANVSLDWKHQMIRTAVDSHYLNVIGEIGKKEGLHNDNSLVDDAKGCVDAGAKIILLEAAELITDEAIMEDIVDAVGIELVMFELPGPWIDGVHHCDIHRMRRDLIERFGSEVNIGNCDPSEVVPLEAFRRGLGVNGGSQKKAALVGMPETHANGILSTASSSGLNGLGE